MEDLIDVALDDTSIRAMVEMNPNIKELSMEEIRNKIRILQEIGCSLNQVMNIVSSNSMFLDRNDNEIINLIKYLSSKGFSTLNILLDSNPYILNLEVNEIDNYINNRLKNNEILSDIIDDLEGNPILFNEM